MQNKVFYEKRFLIVFLIVLLNLSLLGACDSRSDTTFEADNLNFGRLLNVDYSVPIYEDVAEATDHVTTLWTGTEISFDTLSEYAEGDQLYVDAEVTFTHKNSGKTLTIPMFWYGENTFKVRFAPTEYGVRRYETHSPAAPYPDGRSGSIAANSYLGDPDIYKYGYVTTNGTKHFVYANGKQKSRKIVIKK